MKKIYSITFYLFIGLLLLSAPQAYSVDNPDAVKNQAFFEYAMQVYSRKKPTQNPNGYTITAKEALAEIKTELLLPPAARQLLFFGYMRENYAPHNKYLPNHLTSIILCFLAAAYKDSESTKKILGWAIEKPLRYDFITSYLTQACKLRRFYNKHYLSNLTSNLINYQLDIYTHKHTFLKKRLLLWLIKELNWDVPTDIQIQDYQASYSSPFICKIIRYKFAIIQTLSKDDMDLYYMSCYHLLDGPLSYEIGLSYKKRRSRQNNIFKLLSCRDKCLAYFSIFYWAKLLYCTDYLGRRTYSPGGNVRKDICIDIGTLVTIHGTFMLLVYSFILFGKNSDLSAECLL